MGLPITWDGQSNIMRSMKTLYVFHHCMVLITSGLSPLSEGKSIVQWHVHITWETEKYASSMSVQLTCPPSVQGELRAARLQGLPLQCIRCSFCNIFSCIIILFWSLLVLQCTRHQTGNALSHTVRVDHLLGTSMTFPSYGDSNAVVTTPCCLLWPSSN